MPGFIIHLTEAAMILEHMKEKPDSAWKQEFLLGNLLPDTRLGEDKAISHFWSSEGAENIARAPKLSRFLEKYGHRLNEPVILGYYAHLYLDERYVDEYWPTILTFEDAKGRAEPRKAFIHQVELKESGRFIPFEKFFSSEYYYGDYTRSNHWLVDKYHIQPPEYRYLENVNMDEVDASELERVLKELECICHKGKPGDEKEMKVFNLTGLEDFVWYTAEAFCQHMTQMSHIIDKQGDKWINDI